MAAVQTTYGRRLAKWANGQLATMERHNITSRNVEDATIGFGRAVFQGADDYGVTETQGTAFQGITRRITHAERLEGGVADVYKQGETAEIVEDGVVCVTLVGTVAKGDPVTIGAGGNFQAGAATVLPNTVFDESGVAGDIVPVRISN